MHFSKTYSQILLGLPTELRDNAIQYRQLKKLINQVVLELSSHGLSPDVLQELLFSPDTGTRRNGKMREVTGAEFAEQILGALSKVAYEVTGDSDHIEPRLRLWLDLPDSGTSSFALREACDTHGLSDSAKVLHQPLRDLPEGSQQGWTEVPTRDNVDDIASSTTKEGGSYSNNYAHTQQELVIPLVADGAFFELLSTALRTLANRLDVVRIDFLTTLQDLTATISSSARPMSSVSSFHPHSAVSSDPSASLNQTILLGHNSKSDLYSWRSIFQLYMEAEVFESTKEASRGENSLEESERRLQLFTEQLAQRGLADRRKLKLKESREALEAFLRMNHFILDIKKFQMVSAEATRKILKKHTKRTALPTPPLSHSLHGSNGPLGLVSSVSILPTISLTLSHVLVQAMSETLLPIIPHIDDYACLICTSIAFKPIRLSCGHLFCVRCLVKMQKRGNGDCPICRAPSVLVANRSNVDWALLNFMLDWFPKETKAKAKQNECEAAEEHLVELGLNPQQSCVVM